MTSKSSFAMTLVRPATAVAAVAGPPESDFESLVMELCLILADTDCAFRISGFGQERWPVDVPYDLSTVVEQLPDALTQLAKGRPADIDLYGQGIERTLHLRPDGDLIRIRCTSRTGWVPDPAAEVRSAEEVTSMLTTVAREFAECVRMIWPRHAGRSPFAEWLREP